MLSGLSGLSGLSAIAGGIVPPPAAPTLTSVPGLDTAAVQVNFAAALGATSYNLYLDAANQGPIAPGGSFTPTNLNSHSYTVTAVGPGGESVASNALNGAPLPAAPTSVSINSLSYSISGFELNWLASSSPLVTGYRIYVDTANPPAALDGTSVGATYSVGGKASGTPYNFGVVAVDSLGQAGPMSAVNNGDTLCAAPTNFAAAGNGDGTSNISITPAFGAVSYCCDQTNPPATNVGNPAFSPVAGDTNTIFFIAAVNSDGRTGDVASTTSS